MELLDGENYPKQDFGREAKMGKVKGNQTFEGL